MVQRVSDISLKTLNSDVYQKLRERPRRQDEFHQAFIGPLRVLTSRLKAPTGNSAHNRGRKNVHCIVYLWGDDRRAVREFVRENADYVDECLNSKNSPLHRNWSDEMLDLLQEEFDFYQRATGGEAVVE